VVLPGNGTGRPSCDCWWPSFRRALDLVSWGFDVPDKLLGRLERRPFGITPSVGLALTRLGVPVFAVSRYLGYWGTGPPTIFLVPMPWTPVAAARIGQRQGRLRVVSAIRRAGAEGKSSAYVLSGVRCPCGAGGLRSGGPRGWVEDSCRALPPLAPPFGCYTIPPRFWRGRVGQRGFGLAARLSLAAALRRVSAALTCPG